MSEIAGVVHIRPAPGKTDEVLAALATCAEQTRQEEGCLRYDVHRDNADPDHLILLEQWRSQADLDAHMTTSYVADLFAVAGTPGMLAAAPDLTFATAVDAGGGPGA